MLRLSHDKLISVVPDTNVAGAMKTNVVPEDADIAVKNILQKPIDKVEQTKEHLINQYLQRYLH